MAAPPSSTVDAARTGDRAAFAVLYDAYARPLYWDLLARLHRREDAEDALHTAFLTAWRRLPELRSPEPRSPEPRSALALSDDPRSALALSDDPRCERSPSAEAWRLEDPEERSARSLSADSWEDAEPWPERPPRSPSSCWSWRESARSSRRSSWRS